MSSIEPIVDGGGEDFLLAAEYVIGLVGGSARLALSRRAEADPVFAGHVAYWEQRLTPLAEEIDAIAAPASIWARIQAEIGRIPVPRAEARPRPSLWDSLAFWRGFGAVSAALAVAAVAALVVFVRPVAPAAPQPELVAMLGNGTANFTAIVDRGAGTLTLVPAAVPAIAADRAHELWLIPAGSAPRSLGTFSAQDPVTIRLPQALAAAAVVQAALAVSVEPQGGSPTGGPTGPVIASGALRNI